MADELPEELEELAPLPLRDEAEELDTRLVAARIADAPREALSPELVLPLELATVPAESPVAPVLPPPEDDPELRLAVLPPDELPPPDEVDPPPVEARVEVENERLSRPYPLRLPRNWGVSRAEAFAAEVEPVNRMVRCSIPARTV